MARAIEDFDEDLLDFDEDLKALAKRAKEELESHAK